MATPYIPAKWYWVVAGDTTRVFSGRDGAYVPLTDAKYLAWVALGNVASPISSEQELVRVLTHAGVDIGVLADTTEIPVVPLWALKAALAAFSGGDKESSYTTWITANKATRINLFYQWQCGNTVERGANLVGSIVSNTGLTQAQMTAIFRDAKKRAGNGSGVS